jgi:hypothetical protein
MPRQVLSWGMARPNLLTSSHNPFGGVQCKLIAHLTVHMSCLAVTELLYNFTQCCHSPA